MNTPKLVHLAIRLYPPQWRKRYGEELEQMTIDVIRRRPGALKSARVFADLLSNGATKRAATVRPAHVAMSATFCAIAAAALTLVLAHAPPSNSLPPSFRVAPVAMVKLKRADPVPIRGQSMAIVALVMGRTARGNEMSP